MRLAGVLGFFFSLYVNRGRALHVELFFVCSSMTRNARFIRFLLSLSAICYGYGCMVQVACACNQVHEDEDEGHMIHYLKFSNQTPHARFPSVDWSLGVLDEEEERRRRMRNELKNKEFEVFFETRIPLCLENPKSTINK